MSGTEDKNPENCVHGFPAMPGGQVPGRQVLQTLDDGLGAELPGAATGTGPMSGVQEGPSKWGTSHPQPKPELCGKGGGRKKDDKGDRYGGNETRTFRTTFPEKAGPRPCPVEGCSDQAAMRISIRVHFWHCHVQETVVILE